VLRNGKELASHRDITVTSWRDAEVNPSTPLHPISRFEMRKLLRLLTLSAAALACAAPGQAATITFDGALNTDFAPFAPLMTHTDAVIEGDFYIGTYSTKDGAQWGDLVGALVDGSDIANTCTGLKCPSNNPTTFLAAVNDGLPDISRVDFGTFNLLQFDVSFIAGFDAIVPDVSLYLRLAGWDEFGALMLEDLLLPGPDADGNYNFETYVVSDAFADRPIVELAFYGYACDAAGSCTRALNGAQFGLDNIVMASDAAAVPEPASLLLAALGLGAMVRRRRQAV
jgi:hypothetical protein